MTSRRRVLAIISAQGVLRIGDFSLASLNENIGIGVA